MQTKVKNILVIRSATRIMNQTLKGLKQEFPLSRITVLAPESVQEDGSRVDPKIQKIKK